MNKTLVPCGHRVIVRPDKYENADPVYQSAKQAGFHLIQDNREQAGVVTGVVVSIGPTAWDDFGGIPWAQVGDKVYYAKFSGKNIELAPEDPMIVLNDEDIVAVVKEV